MVDMAKLKEDALKRKREHEEEALKRQVGNQMGATRRRGSAAGRASAKGKRRREDAEIQVAQKRKRPVSRWVLDILLVLGALLVLLIFINPF